MKVIFSHGKEGSPNGKKASLIKSVCEELGLSFIAPDYSSIPSPDARVLYLENIIASEQDELILVGSSMGAYVSTVLACKRRIKGLYLIAPALYMKGYNIQEYKPKVEEIHTRHGWNDEIIPYQKSIKFSYATKSKLELVEDNHRMSETLSDLEHSFNRFLVKLINQD